LHETRTQGEAAVSLEKGENADARGFVTKSPRILGEMGLGQTRDAPNSNRRNAGD